MSFVISSARKQLITLMKADLNFKLMIISSRMQRNSAEVQRLTEEKAETTKRQINNLVTEKGSENVTYADISQISFMTADIDTELALLAANDDEMECEMKMIETQLQTLNAEEEEIGKLQDNSIKKEFGIFAS